MTSDADIVIVDEVFDYRIPDADVEVKPFAFILGLIPSCLSQIQCLLYQYQQSTTTIGNPAWAWVNATVPGFLCSF